MLRVLFPSMIHPSTRRLPIPSPVLFPTQISSATFQSHSDSPQRAPPTSESITLHTDASGAGYGAVLTRSSVPDQSAHTRQVIRNELVESRFHAANTGCQGIHLPVDADINQHERYAILWALYREKKKLRGKAVSVYTDNQGAAEMFRRCGAEKEEGAMDNKYGKAFRTLAKKEDMDIDVMWIPRQENKAADRLSKLAKKQIGGM